MKKIFLGLLLAIALMNPVKSQEAGNLAYNIGDKYIHAGLGLGSFGLNYTGSRYGFTLPLSVSAEYGFHEYISAGGFLGYARYRYRYLTSYEYSWTYVTFGGRGTFHFTSLLNEHLDLGIDETKFDFYVSVIAGLEIQSYRNNSEYTGFNYSSGVRPIFGPFFGAKYMLTENIGAFIEGGRTASGWGTLGVSFRF